MIPAGIWIVVYVLLIVVGLGVAVFAAPLDDPLRIPIFSLGSVVLSVGLLAVLGAVLEYLYLPN
jgi:hypothetical protein